MSSVLLLLMADGQQIAAYSGYTKPVWIGDDQFVAYQEAALPPMPMQLVSVPAILGNALDGSTSEVNAPCCHPLGNGFGAVAVNWFLPQFVEDLDRPQFSIWSDGESGMAQEGFPFAWSPTGDRLAVQHPFAPSRGLTGWLEVVEWPSLTTILEGDHDKAVSDAKFDPTGGYVAYTDVIDAGQGNFELEIDVVTLATGDVGRIPIVGNRSTFAWNAQSELIVSDVQAGGLVTYRPDGNQVADEPTEFATGVESSSDGSTVLLRRLNSEFDELWVVRDGQKLPLPAVDGRFDRSYLSPDGRRLIVLAVSARGMGAWLADVP